MTRLHLARFTTTAVNHWKRARIHTTYRTHNEIFKFKEAFLNHSLHARAHTFPINNDIYDVCVCVYTNALNTYTGYLMIRRLQRARINEKLFFHITLYAFAFVRRIHVKAIFRNKR